MTDSPAVKALRYAENELGVHKVYNEARQARQSLDNTLTALSERRDSRRDVEERIIFRELDLTSDERGKHADMSEAAMARHLKLVFHGDSELQQLRTDLRELQDSIEGLEYDKLIAETDIKIAVSRLQELGGYLQYLAVIKSQAGSA